MATVEAEEQHDLVLDLPKAARLMQAGAKVLSAAVDTHRREHHEVPIDEMAELRKVLASARQMGGYALHIIQELEVYLGINQDAKDEDTATQDAPLEIVSGSGAAEELKPDIVPEKPAAEPLEALEEDTQEMYTNLAAWYASTFIKLQVPFTVKELREFVQSKLDTHDVKLPPTSSKLWRDMFASWQAEIKAAYERDGQEHRWTDLKLDGRKVWAISPLEKEKRQASGELATVTRLADHKKPA